VLSTLKFGEYDTLKFGSWYSKLTRPTESGRVALQMHDLRTVTVDGSTLRFAGTLKVPHRFTADFTHATVDLTGQVLSWLDSCVLAG